MGPFKMSYYVAVGTWESELHIVWDVVFTALLAIECHALDMILSPYYSSKSHTNENYEMLEYNFVVVTNLSIHNVSFSVIIHQFPIQKKIFCFVFPELMALPLV